VTRWKKAGEQTGARGALLPLTTAPQGQNESPASLPFTSFYSSAKQVLVSALKGAALPNTKSSLLAPEHCEQRTATVWIPQPPWYTCIFIADLYNVSVPCPVWPCVCVCVRLYCYKYTDGQHIGREDRGSTVVKAMCHKSEGRWFDPSWCQWIFYWHKILPIDWGRLSL